MTHECLHYYSLFEPCCQVRDFSKDKKVFSALSTCFSCLSLLWFSLGEHIAKTLSMSVSPDFYCCHFVILGFPSCQMLAFVYMLPRITHYHLFGVFIIGSEMHVRECLCLKVGGLMYESCRRSTENLTQVLPKKH